MKKEVIILLIIFLIGLSSAEFKIGKPLYSIENSYSPESNLRGWLNISFVDEPANFVFTDSLDNSITLLDFLELGSYTYECSPADCKKGYIATSPSAEKKFLLKQGEKKIIGLVLDKEITDINSISFVLSSNATSYCYNQVMVDFFDKGEILKGNNKSKSSVCPSLKKTGCFNSSKTLIETPISETPFCQRLELSESPSFEIGAWIKQKQSGNKKIYASLYDKYGTELTSCEINKSLISDSGSEVSCRVYNLVTKKEDFYVCVFSNSGSGEYLIRGHSLLEGCGFYGPPVENENAGYQIFAKGLEFDSVGDLLVEDRLEDGNSVSNFAEEYLLDKYGNLDCSSENCIIPIKIISNKNQEIILKNLKLVYSTPGFPNSEENKFYDIQESPPLINSEFQEIYFEQANFTLPEKFGNITYKFYFNDEKLFSEKILIESVPVLQGIAPRKTFAAFQT